MDRKNMHFIKKSSGKIPVILLHYFGGAGNSWEGVMNSLSDNARCIAPDLCGFGISQKPEAALSVDDYANDVISLVEALQLERYVLIGHSMSGKIALAAAARRPKGLASVVLVAPSPPTPEPMSDDAREEMLQLFGDAEKIRKHLEDLSMQSLPTGILEKEVANHLQISRSAWNGWLNSGTREDISNRMQRIEVPVFVLGGGADKTFTQALLQQEVIDRIGSNAQLQMIPNGGHLMPLEWAEGLAKSISEVLPAL